MTMHPCETVGTTFFETGKRVYSASVEIAATPEQIFACFEDAASWPKWAPPITDVIWTSPKPYGLGTTRTVKMIGITGDEEFIAWDYPKRMAFCFTHCSQKMVRSFAEDYQVVPLDNGKTQVTWTMGLEMGGIGNVSMALSGPFMAPALKWMLKRFKRHVEVNFT